MFRFKQRTEIVFGEDALSALPEELIKRDIRKLLLVCDSGIEEAGVLVQVTNVLKRTETEYHIFNAIEANPTDNIIIKGADICRSQKCDGVLAVGGGSPIDAAKAIAMLAVNDGSLKTYCGAGADPWEKNPLFIIAIPTTAGTGAEVSGAAMINLVDEQRKVDIFGRSITPQIAIIDPVLTIGLPSHLTATTGLDALSHAMEAYVARFANPVTDMFAVKSIELVAENIRKAYVDGTNLEARAGMLLASSLAVLACSAGLGCIHSVAQTIGGYYNLPHGLTISVCLPSCCEFNLFAAPKKYAHIARIFGANTSGMNEIDAARMVVPILRELLLDLKITDTLSTLGVKKEDLDALAHNCMLDGSTPGNPRLLSEEAFKTLISKMLSE